MFKTAESVSMAHPDKVCDQISDAILDECLKQDPFTRAAIETLGGHGVIAICGELTTNAQINARKIARDVYRDCGYTDEIGIVVNIVEQSPEIKKGVDNDGAGDQGIMVGYATSETEELLPLEVVLARKLTRAMGRHDGKAQVTLRKGKVETLLTSFCESGDTSDATFETAAKRMLKQYGDGKGKNWLRNPNGTWTIGGFHADTGLTGRKLAVDNYGPSIPLGGGAFSGKDATKVDRSGAYIARRVTVDYLRKKGAKEAYVHVAYAIGVAEPLMAVVTLDGKQEKIKGYDLRPKAIIEYLDLRKPIYRETAKHGHFGNGFTWDR